MAYSCVFLSAVQKFQAKLVPNLKLERSFEALHWLGTIGWGQTIHSGGITRIASPLVQIAVDGAIYALRNIIERCFNKLKNARRLATRYDKTANSYSGFIRVISIRLWMKQFVNRS